MTTTPALPAIIAAATTGRDMHLRPDLTEPGWTFWERRTLNIHRVVGLKLLGPGIKDVRALDAELRGTLARNFKRAWWRGIAYGVVANVGALTLGPDDLKVLVDVYENNKGTMQWVILLAGDTPQATGVHTWVEGFLSPVYREVLAALESKGYKITSAMKEKTGLLKFLTAVADGRTRALTGHGAFPEFRDPFQKEDAAAPPKNSASL